MGLKLLPIIIQQLYACQVKYTWPRNLYCLFSTIEKKSAFITGLMKAL